MSIVLYTQRVDIIESYHERRDCADQNIPRFLSECGYLPVPVPNISEIAEKMLLELNPAGIVFTGGNSLVVYGGQAPERDRTEERILEIAIQRDIPVYGFCRGMQVILQYFGCTLEDVKGHVAVHHMVDGIIGRQEVNSFHNQACFQVTEPLEVLARSEDGVVEAICVKGKKICATMWHPEREEFRKSDVKRIQSLFLKEGL